MGVLDCARMGCGNASFAARAPQMKTLGAPIDLWITTLAGHQEYRHCRMLGGTVDEAIRESSRVGAEIIRISGQPDRPAVYAAARMVTGRRPKL